jgi:hypothetical protein
MLVLLNAEVAICAIDIANFKAIEHVLENKIRFS